MTLRKHYSASTFLIIGLILFFIAIVGGVVFFIYRMTSDTPPSDDFDDIEMVDNGDKKDDTPEEEPVKELQKGEVAKVIAEELNIKYPITKKYKTLDKIKKQIYSGFHKKTKKKYTNKALTKSIQKLVFKYASVQPGQQVEFYIKTPGQSISSRDILIKGKLISNYKRRITVGKKTYSLFDIDPDYQYLFDENRARQLCQEKIKETKTDFKKRKETAFEKYKPKLEKKYYTKAGYILDEDGNWLSGQEYINKTIGKAEKLHAYLTGNQ